jgi:dihydroorotate dehydrogenase
MPQLIRADTLSGLDSKIRPLVTKLPPKAVVAIYSKGRSVFLNKHNKELPGEKYEPPKHLKRVLWGIEFRSPIMNAAGMFKNGEGYETVAAQGAGAYLSGTTTYNPWAGNTINGIRWPVAPYPLSHAASNKLGLPNEGDQVIYVKMWRLKRISGCPIGISVMTSPDLKGDEGLSTLVKGMRLYEEAGVDFIELNVSCPNAGHGRLQIDALPQMFLYVKRNFLDSRQRGLPVIVKFSTDTNPDQVPDILNLLFNCGFDGVNFGNTSTDYAKRREMIEESERKLFDYFTSKFGGGVSGAPLREDSLMLCSAAVRHVRLSKPMHEFHVIRTGGVSSAEDIMESERIGVSLNQWYTGYFENFARYGHGTYAHIYRELLRDLEYMKLKCLLQD